MSAESIQFREPSEEERRLIALVADKAASLAPTWIQTVKVRRMKDGGMGSLELAPDGASIATRRFGSKAAEIQFTDDDGVEVLVSLNLDTDGIPFELDVWKTDFSPLLRVPVRP